MRRNIFAILILALFVSGLAFAGTKLFLTLQRKGQAGLKIDSTPQASVFIDNKFKSKTPFNEKLPAGKYLIKLTPEGTDVQTASWQHKIELSADLLTYINRKLGSSELNSAGEILTLSKLGNNNIQIAVISNPDGATVALDGEEKGNTPLVINDVAPGEHVLYVFAPGFNGRQVSVKVTAGYKLNADIQLALASEETEASQSATAKEASESGKTKVKVKILETPTGWLRVRKGPSLSATEAAKVNPGQLFPFLQEEKGWFKIEYTEGEQGWISSRYAQKVEE